MERTIVT